MLSGGLVVINAEVLEDLLCGSIVGAHKFFSLTSDTTFRPREDTQVHQLIWSQIDKISTYLIACEYNNRQHSAHCE